MKTYQFGAATLHVDHARRYAETRFGDGLVVPAIPHDTEEYRQRALALGYRDPWEMCWRHEGLHSALAAAQGLPYSPVLRAVAEGAPLHTREAGLEEDLVLVLQAYLNRVRWVPEWMAGAGRLVG